MQRRELLKGALGLAASSALTACMRRVPVGAPQAMPPNACGLPPVSVSAEREIRTVVGLRPFRASGFRVEVEKLGDKVLVHNYGHGGGGITLSWGTAHLAVDLAQPQSGSRAAVLGCGVVGLSTARLLQERGVAVTIYTKDLPPNTTSNIAGGQWCPVTVFHTGETTPDFMRQFRAASEFAYRRYQLLVGPRYGVRWMTNYRLDNQPFREDSITGIQSPVRDLMPEFRDLSPHEHPFTGYPYARQWDSMIIEPPTYLVALLNDFRIAGGAVVVRAFPDPAAVAALSEPIVFNCTGLGARDLFGDSTLEPIKGQLTILLPQPEVTYAVLPGDFYMFSRTDGILLGGTHERGNWSLDINETAKAAILKHHAEFFGSFRKC